MANFFFQKPSSRPPETLQINEIAIGLWCFAAIDYKEIDFALYTYRWQDYLIDKKLTILVLHAQCIRFSTIINHFSAWLRKPGLQRKIDQKDK